VFELHRFHADPNPGNYLFREDGKLGLIDFGCVKTLTPRFAVNLSTLYKSVVAFDTETLLDTYRELGMLKPDSGDGFSKAYFDTILSPFFDWVSRAFKHEYFDFAANAGYAAESLKLFENIRTFAARYWHQKHMARYWMPVVERWYLRPKFMRNVSGQLS